MVSSYRLSIDHSSHLHNVPCSTLSGYADDQTNVLLNVNVLRLYSMKAGLITALKVTAIFARSYTKMDDSFQLKTATEDTSSLSLVTPDSRNSDATQSSSSSDSFPNVSVVLHGQVLRVPFADRRPNARRRLRSHSVGATPIRIVHRGNPFRRQQEIAHQNVVQVRRIVRRHSGNTRRNPQLEMTLEDQIAVDPENFMFQPMCNGDQYDVLPLHPPPPAEFIEDAGNTPVFARSPEGLIWEHEEDAVTPLDELRTATELLAFPTLSEMTLSATPRTLSPVTAKELSVLSESSLSSSPF